MTVRFREAQDDVELLPTVVAYYIATRCVSTGPDSIGTVVPRSRVGL